jgi:hypothetical protein
MPRFIPRGSATPVDDFKESRMEFDNATNSTGNPGEAPPSFCFALSQLSVVTPFWESIGNHSSLSQVR